jgi:hypothetical protein
MARAAQRMNLFEMPMDLRIVIQTRNPPEKRFTFSHFVRETHGMQHKESPVATLHGGWSVPARKAGQFEGEPDCELTHTIWE